MAPFAIKEILPLLPTTLYHSAPWARGGSRPAFAARETAFTAARDTLNMKVRFAGVAGDCAGADLGQGVAGL